MNFYTERLGYQVNILMTGEMKHRLLMASKELDVSISELIRIMIDKELKIYEQEKD